MRKFLALAAAIGALAAAAPASADTWRSINQRQATLEHRIETGVRTGALTQAEARTLRAEFNALERLETHYRLDGLSAAERADLDRRFDGLERRIHYQRQDDQRAWVPIAERSALIDARIDAGVRDRSLTRNEAERLRRDLYDLTRLEERYRLFGLNEAERRDLDRRYDQLASRVRAERHDGQVAQWNINERQATLDARIRAGRLDGTLSEREAMRLRAEFNDIARLEQHYRVGGLSNAERADLHRRFDTLTAQIYSERHDGNRRRS